MSRKLLLFGHERVIQAITAKLRGGHPVAGESQVKVETLNVLQKEFLVFSIYDRALIASQATGSNGLIFFLDPSVPLYEEKQFLFDLLQEKREFEELPIVIAFQRQADITIKEVINYFELYKVKDRPSMIKEISLDQLETIIDMFKWIDSQIDFRRTKTFDAQPKVVKIKPKYRESDPEASEEKYNGLMKERNFKTMLVKDQQQTYIVREKDRIKDENMKAQLSNFSKNKKKMAPYDIKPTPNPKIQANLHFFLKDPKNEKEAEVNIKIQTDEFKPRPKEKAYIPKKTGINIATQIEENELFDFDKEVNPILEILISKALETAALEIEEEEEFLKMAKYRATYNERVKKQKTQEQKNIQNELDLMEEKKKLLQRYRDKDRTRRNVIRKTLQYEVSNNFLRDIYAKSALNVYERGYYRNDLDNLLRTDYLDTLIGLTAQSYERIVEKEQAIEGIFEKDCIDPLIQPAKAPRQKNEVVKNERLKRRTNKGSAERYIHVYYEQPGTQLFSSFSKFIGKHFDGTLEEFIRSKEDEIQGLQDKLSTGDTQEEDLNKAKNFENENFSKSHKAILMDSESKVCFAVTSNRFQKPSKRIVSPGIIAFNLENQPSFSKIFDEDPPETSSSSFYMHVKDLRNPRDVVNLDEGILVDLKKVPEDIKTLVFFQKINNIGQFSGEASTKNFKCASYGFQIFERAIPIHREDIGQQLKWEEIIKPPEGEQNQGSQEEQDLMVVSYSLSRKYDMQHWYLEDVKYASKPMKSEDITSFLQSLSKFYKESVSIFKNEEDDEPGRASSSKRVSSRSNKRIKSKKALEEQEATRKKASMNQFVNRALGSVYIDLSWPWSQAQDAISNSIKDWKEFVEYCGELGWQVTTKSGKPLESIDQIRKFSKIGDIRVSKVQPKIEEVQQPQQKQGQGEEDPEESQE